MSDLFVYFDAGFTLIHPYPSIGHWYGSAARRHGIDVPTPTLDAAFFKAWKVARSTCQHAGELPYGRTREEALAFWSEVIRACFVESGVEAPADPEYYREVFDQFATAECWRQFADVESAFARLDAARVRYGVLSNWDARLAPVLKEMRLLPRLGAVIVSSDVGAEKPSAAIFAAGELAASPATRFALIGDEPEADGRGALAAGWGQCLVWRSQKPAPEGLASAPTLLDAVEDVLARWG